jgi:hypothetical protein
MVYFIPSVRQSVHLPADASGYSVHKSSYMSYWIMMKLGQKNVNKCPSAWVLLFAQVCMSYYLTLFSLLCVTPTDESDYELS